MKCDILTTCPNNILCISKKPNLHTKWRIHTCLRCKGFAVRTRGRLLLMPRKCPLLAGRDTLSLAFTHEAGWKNVIKQTLKDVGSGLFSASTIELDLFEVADHYFCINCADIEVQELLSAIIAKCNT